MQKIGLNAGFSCPNRDGTKGQGGCLYCNNDAFSLQADPSVSNVEQQLRQGIEWAKRRRKTQKVMAYFQSFSNTYASMDELHRVYETVRGFPEIVSLAVGTRPDCIDAAKLDYFSSFCDRYEVWLEYGLQSGRDETLRAVNRGHTVADFIAAVRLTRAHPGIKICAHVIFGLPGESRSDMMKTIDLVNELRIEGIKFHPLHAVRNTGLARLYDDNSWRPLSRDTYTSLVMSGLERLNQQVVIQRLTADCPRDLLIAPEWLSEKGAVVGEIEEKMTRNNVWQGKKQNDIHPVQEGIC